MISTTEELSNQRSDKHIHIKKLLISLALYIFDKHFTMIIIVVAYFILTKRQASI